MEAIGIYTSNHQHKIETPRQGVLTDSKGEIHLHSGFNFEQALEDLIEFERIWLIYQFHLNENWKPKVTPPIPGDKEKVGLFATRSPYRPNNIGLSCVKLIQIKSRVLTVTESDLLDQTPILDIKPYLPYADSFPEARIGWPNQQEQTEYQLHYSEHILEQINYLKDQIDLDFKQFIQTQLSHDPTNQKKKRIACFDGESHHYTISYRTWRIEYKIKNTEITLLSIRSGYSKEDLENENDPYKDKSIHLSFQKRYTS